MTRQGLVHLYAGGGKGKTTAAVGLCVRAAGRGFSVLFVQFLKGRETGELTSLKSLGITILRDSSNPKFLFQMTGPEAEQYRQNQRRCFWDAAGRISSGGYDLVVLDEVVDAVNLGILSEEELTDLIRSRPPAVELVLTGHDPSDALIAASDYYSEILPKKHPYESGIAARRGIEY